MSLIFKILVLDRTLFSGLVQYRLYFIFGYRKKTNPFEPIKNIWFVFSINYFSMVWSAIRMDHLSQAHISAQEILESSQFHLFTGVWSFFFYNLYIFVFELLNKHLCKKKTHKIVSVFPKSMIKINFNHFYLKSIHKLVFFLNLYIRVIDTPIYHFYISLAKENVFCFFAFSY